MVLSNTGLMVVVLVRWTVILALAALCWAMIIGAYVVWGVWAGSVVSVAWVAAGVVAIFCRETTTVATPSRKEHPDKARVYTEVGASTEDGRHDQ
jgi:hypothetical protein